LGQDMAREYTRPKELDGQGYTYFHETCGPLICLSPITGVDEYMEILRFCGKKSQTRASLTGIKSTA